MNKLFFDKSLNTIFEKLGYEYEDMLNLMKDTARGVQSVDKREAEDKIRGMMFEVLELRPEDVNNKKLFKRAMKNNRSRFFEVIEDVVSDMLVQGWSEDPFFNDFVETKNLAVGDANEFYAEDNSVLVASKVSGNHHDLLIQRLGEGETFAVKTSTCGVKVGTDIQMFLADRKDWTELVNAVYAAFDKKVKDTIYKEVIGVGAKLPASDMFNKAIQLNAGTKPQVDQLIEDVSAANGGSEVVIMGTSSAVKKLTALSDVNWISESMKDQKNQTGRLGFYEGTALQEIPQRLVRNGNKLDRLVDNSMLLVLPVGMDKFVKFVNVGDAEIIELINQGDYSDDLMTFEYQQTFGVATVVGKYFGAIKITG